MIGHSLNSVSQEALAYTLELKRQQLESEGKSASETDLQVALLADLQQVQDKECSDIMTSAIDMVSSAVG